MNDDLNGNGSNIGQTPGQTPAPQPQGSKGKAIASLVLGIVSVAACCIPAVPFICAVVGLILGGLSLKNKEPGRGMAIGGLVLSIIGVVWGILYLILYGIGTAAILSGM